MNIEITEDVKQVKTIDVELPYYYEHDVSGEFDNNMIYGMITETEHISIQERISYLFNTPKYEVEKTTHKYIKSSGLSGYFKDEYISSKEEFEGVKSRLVKFVNTL